VISQTAEYALRSVVYLGSQAGQPVTTQRIAAATQVPAGYLSKVLQGLGRAGLRGNCGMRASSIVLAARGAPEFCQFPRLLTKARGTAHRVARSHSAREPLRSPRGALRRAVRRFFGVGPRFPRAFESSPRSAGSRRRVIVPAGGAPTPPERAVCETAPAGAGPLPNEPAQPVRVPSGERAKS